MAGENDDNLDLETPNEGLETEADADGQDGDEAEVGLDAEGSPEGDGSEPEDGQEVEGEPQRRPTRGEARFQTLSRTAREANERAARLETEGRELRERLARLEQPRQEQPKGKSAEELALMTPDELINYRLGESEKRFQTNLGQIQWNTYEAGDRAAFNALKATDPLAAKYADEVETRLTALRAQGQNVDRERLLTYIIGEKARQGGGAARKKQAAAGQKRIQGQQARPSGGQRSDTPTARGRLSEADARAKRLENVTF